MIWTYNIQGFGKRNGPYRAQPKEQSCKSLSFIIDDF